MNSGRSLSTSRARASAAPDAVAPTLSETSEVSSSALAICSTLVALGVAINLSRSADICSEGLSVLSIAEMDAHNGVLDPESIAGHPGAIGPVGADPMGAQ